MNDFISNNYFLLKEGKAFFLSEKPKIVSKEMSVFFNEKMSFSRTLLIILLRTINNYYKNNMSDNINDFFVINSLKLDYSKTADNFQFCDLMAGTGVRSLRLLLETNNISSLTVNDFSRSSFDLIKINLSLNNIGFTEWSINDFFDNSIKKEGPGSRIKNRMPIVLVTNIDANNLLINSNGYDFIDIDPFGSPSAFLDNAIKRISRHGFLAVTATDTSLLAGSYPKASLRKYWSYSINDNKKHEFGLRIFLRKIILIGSQYDKALIPIIAYNKDHYYRAIFFVQKGKKKVDELLKKIITLIPKNFAKKSNIKDYNLNDYYSLNNNFFFSLWAGPLGDPFLIKRMKDETKKLINEGFYKSFFLKEDFKNYSKDFTGLINYSYNNSLSELKKLINFLSILEEEYKKDLINYYDINELKGLLKEDRLNKNLLRNLIKDFTPTHHNFNAFKSSLSLKEIKELINDYFKK